jgi:hypothetical protein
MSNEEKEIPLFDSKIIPSFPLVNEVTTLIGNSTSEETSPFVEGDGKDDFQNALTVYEAIDTKILRDVDGTIWVKDGLI